MDASPLLRKQRHPIWLRVLAELLQVKPRAEGVASASNNDHGHVVVVMELFKSITESIGKRPGQRISAFGTVQDDMCHAVHWTFDQYEFTHEHSFVAGLMSLDRRDDLGSEELETSHQR